MIAQDFKQGILYLCEAFSTELSEARAAVYAEHLMHVRAEDWRVACQMAVAGEERFPSVARLLVLARQAAQQRALRQPVRRLPATMQPELADLARQQLARIRRRLRGTS